MGPRHVEFRKARPGIEGLELRIAPAIVAVNGGNTPAEVQVVGGSSTERAGGSYVLTRVSHSATDTSYE
jgi:hypothetical protein